MEQGLNKCVRQYMSPIKSNGRRSLDVRGKSHIPDNNNQAVIGTPEDVLDGLASLKDGVRSTQRAVARTDDQG